MFNGLLRRKPIQTHHIESELHRSLGALDLTLMGIGAIIGAGVFVITGIAAATLAGPAIIISYFIAGLAALFSALAYAELAASIGGTGSAYNYAYTGFGELIAWLIGWNLLLEYIMAVGAVAIGWAGYVNNLFLALHINLPLLVTESPLEGGAVNLLAMLAVLGVTLLSCWGIRESARFNAVIVFIKLATIAIFIGIASMNIDMANWNNFLPFGVTGVIHGAALVFFAYIGFDALSTTVEEAIEPQRTVPVGIVTSLLICTFLYMLVSGLLTLIVPYTTLNVESPVAEALLVLGYRLAGGMIAAGAIAGLTTVMLIMFYGLTRICLAMSRDGLLPSKLAKIHPQTRTPVRIILTTGIMIALIAGFLPMDRAAELVNIGTLTAFTFVCAGVMVFRKTHPHLSRPFKLPFYPLVPVSGILFCLYLMINLSAVTWWRFVIWTMTGILLYFFYGRQHSLLNRDRIFREKEE